MRHGVNENVVLRLVHVTRDYVYTGYCRVRSGQRCVIPVEKSPGTDPTAARAAAPAVAYLARFTSDYTLITVGLLHF